MVSTHLVHAILLFCPAVRSLREKFRRSIPASTVPRETLLRKSPHRYARLQVHVVAGSTQIEQGTIFKVPSLDNPHCTDNADTTYYFNFFEKSPVNDILQ